MPVSLLPFARALLFLAGVLLAAGLQVALLLLSDPGDAPHASPTPHAAGYRSA
jgi:hypothetical protein